MRCVLLIFVWELEGDTRDICMEINGDTRDICIEMMGLWGLISNERRRRREGDLMSMGGCVLVTKSS